MITQIGTTHEAGCACKDCASGKRNRYFRSKSMKADEFRIEQVYGIERRRLLNRSVTGWGVVRGFSLEQEDPPDAKAFTVGDGVGLDRHGREAVLACAATLAAKNTFVLDLANGACHLKPLDSVAGKDANQSHDQYGFNYLLSVHYAERLIGDALGSDPCGCDPPEKNFTCETVVFSLTPLHDGRCPCAEEHCTRTCQCGDEDGGRKHCDCKGRGPHACLCQWVADAKDPKPSKLCEWNGYWIDPADGIPLGCVRAWKTHDECHPIGIAVTDPCGPRRLVKNNDLLYDLIRGCDLTHIQWISWHEWHRSHDMVDWYRFAQCFHPEPEEHGHKRQVLTDFVVRFSGPVLRKTILRDTVVMTAITIEQSSGWRLPRRVPIVRIDTHPHSTSLPEGLTDQMRLYVDYLWYRDEIEKEAQSWLSRTGFGMEIEIRGDLILDCQHQQLDANAHGLDPAPTGNGSPGGTFLSTFWVKPKPDANREPPASW